MKMGVIWCGWGLYSAHGVWKGEDDEMEIHILSYKFKLLKTYCQCLGLGDTSLQCIIALTKKHLVKKSQMIKELGMKTTEVLWSQ